MSTSRVAEAVRKSLDKLGVTSSSRLLVGVSGGVDSMVLIAVLQSLNHHCTAAHVNFQLRGRESDDDEAFVREWCLQNNVTFISHNVDTNMYADEHNLNIQSAARDIRYQWWDRLIKTDRKFDFLVTAHHRDDNIETFFIHMLRGSGLKGLKGIPAKRDYIIRPLLGINKKDIETFARDFEIPFRLDSSNLKDDYLRNRIRHHLIPLIKDLTPAADTFLKQTLQRLDVEWNAWDRAYQRWKSESVTQEHGGYKLQCKEGDQAFILKYLEENGIPWSLVHDYVFAERITSNQPLHYGEFILSRTDSGFYLGKNQVFAPLLIDKPGHYEIPIGQFSIEFKDATSFDLNGDPNVEYISADLIEWPLQIRNVLEGDRFNPIGMQGKTKKLQDFMTDLKLSAHEKSRTCVLTADDQIVWVIGKRLDEKFKVRTGNSIIYKLTFLPF